MNAHCYYTAVAAGFRYYLLVIPEKRLQFCLPAFRHDIFALTPFALTL